MLVEEEDTTFGCQKLTQPGTNSSDTLVNTSSIPKTIRHSVFKMLKIKKEEWFILRVELTVCTKNGELFILIPDLLV